MGQYINPPNETKEEFLRKNGIVSVPVWPIGTAYGLVCLINNGVFNAAGICYSQRELKEFNNPMDTRPKSWYLVRKELLKPYVPDSMWET